jgi:hypothetical protein
MYDYIIVGGRLGAAGRGAPHAGIAPATGMPAART